MAKHAHRIILVDKRLWRCTLPGCSWFVYTGQQQIIMGRSVVCWECGSTFQISEEELKRAYKYDMPKCDQCHKGKDRNLEIPDSDRLERHIRTRTELIKAGVRSTKELSVYRRSIIESMIGMELLDEIELEPDEIPPVHIQSIQSIPSKHIQSDHTPACLAYFDSDEICTCGFKSIQSSSIPSIQSNHSDDCASFLGMACDCRDEVNYE